MNIINQVSKMQSDLIQGKSIKPEDLTTLRVKLEMLSSDISKNINNESILEMLGKVNDL